MLVKIFSQLMASVRALLILGVLIFAKSSTFVSSNISLVRFQMLLIMTLRLQYTVSKNKIYLPLATVFVAASRWQLFFCSHRSKFFFLIQVSSILALSLSSLRQVSFLLLFSHSHSFFLSIFFPPCIFVFCIYLMHLLSYVQTLSKILFCFHLFTIYATLTSCCPFFSFTGSFSQTNTVSRNFIPTCFHRNVAFLGKDFFSAETKQFSTGISIRWWTHWDKLGN